MQLKIQSTSEHKGFFLKEPATLHNNINILTGKNGSGKTRILESLKNNSSVAYLNEKNISNEEIRFIPQSELNPSFGVPYNFSHQQEIIRQTLELYDRIKSELDDENYKSRFKSLRNNGEIEGIGNIKLYDLCQKASKELSKTPSKLTHDDIIIYFEEIPREILGIQLISHTINQYVKRTHDNQRNEWLHQTKNKEVSYWPENQFIDKFGEKPWVILSNILHETFDGKFNINTPDECSYSYNYQAQLIQNNGDSVSIEHLSSGERTLLWLALTIFNAHYYKENEEIKPPSIILLDEPDAFLHPKMVVKMYNTLESLSSNFGSTIIITTHSPTSVALAPENSIFLVESNLIKQIEKDIAIADLLDGVTQISLNPTNRRQVFVESTYDANVYQLIYAKIAHHSKKIDPKITLSFLSSGPKMPRQHLLDAVKNKLGIKDDEVLNEFYQSVNGSGNCDQVTAQVEALTEHDNGTVRGIIDWDLKNKPGSCIKVFANDYAYSIENVTLDPICLLLLLNFHQPQVMPVHLICGEDVTWEKWLSSEHLLQKSIDNFILHLFGKENDKLGELSYISGVKLRTDSKYLTMQGHALEKLLKEKHPALNSFSRKGGDGELKFEVVLKSMINYSSGRFIPSSFEEIFSEVQK